jgi:hypothetical protein
MVEPRFRARVAAGARRLDRHPRRLFAARFVRELLPGDSRFGDPLSTGGAAPNQVAGRRLAAPHRTAAGAAAARPA